MSEFSAIFNSAIQIVIVFFTNTITSAQEWVLKGRFKKTLLHFFPKFCHSWVKKITVARKRSYNCTPQPQDDFNDQDLIL